jgi:hypothetical protein
MLSEEHRLKEFEIKVLTKMFGRKRNKLIEGWWKLRNEELRTTMLFAKYNENDHVKENDMGKIFSTHEKKGDACRILVGNPEGKSPLGIPRCMWEDDIKMDFREI